MAFSLLPKWWPFSVTVTVIYVLFIMQLNGRAQIYSEGKMIPVVNQFIIRGVVKGLEVIARTVVRSARLGRALHSLDEGLSLLFLLMAILSWTLTSWRVYPGFLFYMHDPGEGVAPPCIRVVTVVILVWFRWTINQNKEKRRQASVQRSPASVD